MMRKLLVVLVLCGAFAIGSEVYAVCGSSVPFIHQTTYFQCADGKEVAAYAYHLVNPTLHNSGTENLACEETGFGACISGGRFGDNQVTVQMDWGNSGVVGCPVVQNDFQRIMLLVQCNDGTGIIASLSGDIGYLVDVVHDNNPDPITGAFPPIVADNRSGRAIVRGLSGNQLMLHVDAVAKVYHDCEANSVGLAFGSCNDGYMPVIQRGNVFTSVQPCGGKPDLRRGTWAPGPALDANGDVTVTLQPITQPPECSTDANRCLCTYVGVTAFFGATFTDPLIPPVTPQESSAITGFVSVGGGGGLAPSPVALAVRAEQAAGNVRIRWRTDIELGLAGFNVLAEGKQRSRKVNDALIPATGNGGGKSYEVSIPRGKFQSSRTVVIESVMSDGTTLKSAPAKF